MKRARKERPPARGLRLALLGMAAIGQRAFLTLWRQPVLVVSTMVFPIVYLLILGNAMNRPLEGVPLAVVDEAGQRLVGGVPPRRSRARDAGAASCGPPSSATARRPSTGCGAAATAASGCCPSASRRRGPRPRSSATTRTASPSRRSSRRSRQIWQEVSAPKDVALRSAPPVRLEAYPYLDYLTYLGPAVVCLAIFMGSMVSGGLQVLEDRMFGYHEGYLVTPITTGTLVAGHILAGRDRRVDRGRARARGDPLADAASAGRRAKRRGGAPDRVPDVALDRRALVPALRAGAQREPPARDVRHHQRAALLPVGRALPDRVVPAVAGEGSRRSTR